MVYVLGGHGRLRGRWAPPVRGLGRPEGICETQRGGFGAGGLNAGNFEGLRRTRDLAAWSACNKQINYLIKKKDKVADW